MRRLLDFEYITYEGVRNRVRITQIKHFEFRIVSDLPLTEGNLDFFQDKIGFPNFPYQRKTGVHQQRQRLGKNTLRMFLYSV